MLIQFLSLSLYLLEEAINVSLKLTFPSGLWWVLGGIVWFWGLGFFSSPGNMKTHHNLCD